MRRFFVKKGNVYINYVSLNSNPLRLANTYKEQGNCSIARMPHIIYSEKELSVVLNLHPDSEVLEIKDITLHL